MTNILEILKYFLKLLIHECLLRVLFNRVVKFTQTALAVFVILIPNEGRIDRTSKLVYEELHNLSDLHQILL